MNVASRLSRSVLSLPNSYGDDRSTSSQVKEAAVAQIPLGRFGETQDIANTVAFLASEKADYITKSNDEDGVLFVIDQFLR